MNRIPFILCVKKGSFIYISETESNRVLPVRVRFGSASFSWIQFGFGSVRLHFSRISSGSVRFDFIFGEPVRVRFGSTVFLKIRFEFGSVRFEPNRTVIIRLGSVRFRSLLGDSLINHLSSIFPTFIRFSKISSGSVRFGFIFRESVRVRFGSASFLKNQFGFGSVRLHF